MGEMESVEKKAFSIVFSRTCSLIGSYCSSSSMNSRSIGCSSIGGPSTGALVLWQNPDADVHGQCAVGEEDNLSGTTQVGTRCLSSEVLA